MQLRGKLSEEITRIREIILDNIAFIEAALDDPEHYALDGYGDKLAEDVDKCVDNVDNFVEKIQAGGKTTI